MFKKIEEAIDFQNYAQAQKLITECRSQKVDQLWLKYYETNILEKQGNLPLAENNYRQIIKDSIYPDPKLINLIRNGIERIVKLQQEEKEQEKAKFTQQENSQELAVLVLQEVTLEEKKILAPILSKIMNIDRYTATLQIPTRSWRLYKTGSLGELKYYQSALSQGGLPCFCQPLNKVNKIDVFQVQYLKIKGNNIIFHGKNAQEEQQNIQIKSTEINNWLKVMMPLFELTVNFDAQSKIKKKESTLDYVAFNDLHSLSHNLIFRFNDRSYQFEQDKNIDRQKATTKEKWQQLDNNLTQIINQTPIWSNFTLFAQGVIEFPEMLQQIKPQVELFRREESLWDQALQLYSGLIFLESKSPLNPKN